MQAQAEVRLCITRSATATGTERSLQLSVQRRKEYLDVVAPREGSMSCSIEKLKSTGDVRSSRLGLS